MLYQGDTEEMKHVVQSLASHLMPSNIDNHLPENLFALENKPVPQSLIIVLNKTNLPISNSLISENSAHNQYKPSQDYFQGQNFFHTFENYEIKTIIDTTNIGGIYATLESTKSTQKQGKPSWA